MVPANLHAQAVPSATPPQSALPSAPAAQQQEVDLSTLPRATPLPPEKPPPPLTWDADSQTRQDDLYTFSGNVEAHFGTHTLRADTITYDAATDEMTLTGHVVLTGGNNDEHIEASHGTYNVKLGTGRFYDVNGSVQVREVVPAGAAVSTTSVVGFSPAPQRQGYVTSNPFLFEGRVVVKTGPEDYVVYNGSVTSCLLPHPDWQLFSHKFTIANGVAQAGTSTFKLLGIPVLFLPYVTHPTDTEQRQSGLLIPVFGYSSASNNTGSKGTTIGEQVYLVLGRSIDVTAGILYYSDRGFSENGTVRFKGPGEDFLTAHFSALQDRGFYAPTQTGTTKAGDPIITNVYTNQGGEDVTLGLRKQLNSTTRVVGDGEYLSSYVYREVFTDNFNQAVSSDITSLLYITHEDNGYGLSLRGDRYEGLKVIPVKTQPGEEIKIFHAPSIDFSGIDRSVPGTPLLWSIDASAAGLKRVQPNNFVSSGIIERLDLRPELSLPLNFGGWRTLSSIAVRETFYSRSRQVPYNLKTGVNGPNATPIEVTTPLNRADFEINVDIRPPAIERTFNVPKKWQWLLGDQVRHTVEPALNYRNVHGVDNFLAVLRFDDTDLISDTDELRYGVTQHLYFRPRKQNPRPGCPASDLPYAPEPATDEEAQRPTTDANGIPDAGAQSPDMPTRTHVHKHDPCASTTPLKQQEWFSWELAQKTFFAQNFGGAVINSRRNIFESTLNFSGIAYLTEARAISPVISRMRFRTSSHTDVEWDFDYDTGAKKFNSSNTFLDVHEGNWFGGFSYARLNAPGRFYTPQISTITNTITGVTSSAVSDFSQMRLLIGYGTPSKPGLSAAGGAGIDLKAGSEQYVTIQSGYNWNCCGLSLEYRKYDLGTVRNEGAYRFNFTLANIGSAGNLRRNEALF